MQTTTQHSKQVHERDINAGRLCSASSFHPEEIQKVCLFDYCFFKFIHDMAQHTGFEGRLAAVAGSNKKLEMCWQKVFTAPFGVQVISRFLQANKETYGKVYIISE